MDNTVKNKRCSACNNQFPITAGDVAFYDKISVLEPAECPACREQRRLAWRNEKKFYTRTCEGCHQKIISNFSQDKPHHVYCPKCWWSDKWDPVDVGRDFDFNRPFFEQFQELTLDSKMMALFGKNNENSDFVNHETDDKNCYLNAGGHFNEDSFYNTYSIWGKDTVDNYWVLRCELTYMSIHCEDCYSAVYLQDCKDCSDCQYSRDLVSCKYCFGSIGLKHKEYYFFNEKVSPEEYKEKVEEYKKTHNPYQIQKDTHEHFLKYPHLHLRMNRCENASGNYLEQCKNTYESHLIEKGEDCKYCYIGADLKDCYDLTSFGWGELLYNIGSSMNANTVTCATAIIDVNLSQYCYMCTNSNNLFGCVGLNRKEYCIFNKQYSKEEYEKLVPRIITHMKETGEYGQFFPMAMSPFSYNESIAIEYFPLEEEEVVARNCTWKVKDQREFQPQTYAGSYIITEVEDSICNELLTCKQCTKNYRIIPSELSFYKKMNLDIPIKCPECRHYDRLHMKNPRTLWKRSCHKCKKEIETSYAPDRAEMIYCEKCYLEELYN